MMRILASRRIRIFRATAVPELSFPTFTAIAIVAQRVPMPIQRALRISRMPPADEEAAVEAAAALIISILTRIHRL